MASNANFISQFVMGGDPCTYKESGELQAEMSKLTHPARPDVDWRRVEKLSLALFPAKWRGITDAGLLRTGDNQTAGAGRDGRRTRFTGHTAPALG
ncbi:ImpA-related N-terminal family protein [Escherichia coli]|uniref:ImpA-related N-terminal family protein n=1 Tax=Escherichia coli TaxID=562 RepID=A0A376UF20_ECOLX|nr:ImpA-related N-terminal family protein [Escherichia coli]